MGRIFYSEESHNLRHSYLQESRRLLRRLSSQQLPANGFLPLTSFDLHVLKPSPYKALLEIVIRRLSLRAKDILLKDLMLAEEEQAKPTPNSVHWKAMEENKLRKLGQKVSKACLLMYAPAAHVQIGLRSGLGIGQVMNGAESGRRRLEQCRINKLQNVHLDPDN
jgi:hypothetical protein